MQHNSAKEQLAHLRQLSTEDLKNILAKLEHQHDILEAKNEDMNNQIADLRNAVKCVETERKDSVTFELQKKKQLEDKIDSLEKGLQQALKNKHYSGMVGYKALLE